MSTTSQGRQAEAIVATKLREDGHTILSMNWRNRYAEIDIISKKKGIVYFTEVKYRSSSSWGSGLDYITSKKLKQMKFAAELWATENKWNGEMVLNASEVNSSNGVDIVELD